MATLMERGLTLVLSLSAATIAGSVAWREFGTQRPNVSAVDERLKPVYASGWEKALQVGIRVGAADARVSVVEFTDLECPACRRFQTLVRETLQEYPRDVALIFVHLPMSGHRFAMQAARVAECAEGRGRFLPMIEAIFAKQDSVGLKSWGSFALDAGIQDSAAISACAWDSRPVSRIDAGLALAGELDVNATPTVLVNGVKMIGPTKEMLHRAIDSAIRGKALTDSPD